MPTFINPYTYISLPSRVLRGRARGHHQLAVGQYSGTIIIELEAKTPLLLDSMQGADQDTGDPVIRGSALHGVVRSTHEALTGSCLRVLDQGYVAVHRQLVEEGGDAGLRMAVVKQCKPVTGSEAPVPTWVTVVDDLADTVQIDSRVLRRLGGDIRTGDVLTIPPESIRTWETMRPNGQALDLPRRVFDDGHAVEVTVKGAYSPERKGEYGGDDYIILVANRSKHGDQNTRAWFWALRVAGATRDAEVPESVRKRFVRAASKADDMRPATQDTHEDLVAQGQTAPGFDPVSWPPRQDRVGYRRRVDAGVMVGQPLWVVLGEADHEAPHAAEGNDTVTEIRPARAWRYEGAGSVGKRAKGFLPCSGGWTCLCPSCSVFGAAQEGEGEAEAVQNSYAGHVRFGDAHAADGTWGSETKVLATQGSPKPSAGQFSLESPRNGNRELPPLQPGERTIRPLATWGSRADRGGQDEGDLGTLRRIRGRRVAWRTLPDNGGIPPRALGPGNGALPPQDAGGNSHAKVKRLVTGPAKFKATISFDGLTLAQLGGLLLAVDLNRIKAVRNDPRFTLNGVFDPERELVAALGGGKSFGLGSVVVRITGLHTSGASSRYLGTRRDEDISADCAVRAFLDACAGDGLVEGTAICTPEAPSASWADLVATHALGWVPDEEVKFPGAEPGDMTEQGWQTWKLSAGGSYRDNAIRHSRLLPLPGAHEPAQRQRLPLAEQMGGRWVLPQQNEGAN